MQIWPVRSVLIWLVHPWGREECSPLHPWYYWFIVYHADSYNISVKSENSSANKKDWRGYESVNITVTYLDGMSGFSSYAFVSILGRSMGGTATFSGSFSFGVSNTGSKILLLRPKRERVMGREGERSDWDEITAMMKREWCWRGKWRGSAIHCFVFSLVASRDVERMTML